ncbi:hypothetical protein GX865_05835, partial [Candidatus Saccharibacteria bacterium]|nr:hypothetical protein [Candidatus Saccharibacteria bacterium]
MNQDRAITPIPPRRSFLEILGPPKSRYFGRGFRRVEHEADSVSIAVTKAGASIRGVGSAYYPEDWSLDAAEKPRDTHLSTFDAVILTGMLLHAASEAEGIIVEAMSGTIEGLQVKAPAQS